MESSVPVSDDLEIARALQAEYDRESRELQQQNSSNRSRNFDYRDAGYQNPNTGSAGQEIYGVQVVCSMCRVANQVPWTGPGTQSFRCNRCAFLNYYDATIYGRRRPYRYDDDFVPMPVICNIS